MTLAQPVHRGRYLGELRPYRSGFEALDPRVVEQQIKVVLRSEAFQQPGRGRITALQLFPLHGKRSIHQYNYGAATLPAGGAGSLRRGELRQSLKEARLCGGLQLRVGRRSSRVNSSADRDGRIGIAEGNHFQSVARLVDCP